MAVVHVQFKAQWCGHEIGAKADIEHGAALRLMELGIAVPAVKATEAPTQDKQVRQASNKGRRSSGTRKKRGARRPQKQGNG